MQSYRALTAIIATSILIPGFGQLALAQNGPQVTLSANSLNFGQMVIGQQQALGVFATNTGDEPLIFTGVSATAGFSDDNDTQCFLYNPFAPGAGCNFYATMVAPTPGIYNGVLTLTDNAPDSPQLIALSGKATALQFSPTRIAFGTYVPGQTSTPQQVTIKNVWNTIVNISNLSFSGTYANDFSIGSQTCVTALVPSDSCTFEVTFTPSALATETATLTITDDEPGGPDTVSAKGDGTYLLLTPRRVDIEKADLPKVTLTNAGGTPITFRGYIFTGPGESFFGVVGTTCGATLAAGANCTVTVSYQNADGLRSAFLNIFDDEPGSPQQTLFYIAK